MPQLSDHCPTLLSISYQHTQQPTSSSMFWDYKNADWPGLKDYFADLNWTPVLAATQPEEALEHWYSLVSLGMKLFVPEKQVRIRPSNRPWYSSRLCRIRRQRDRLFNRSKKLPASHRLSLAYRQVRNWYVAELRSAERAFYREVSSQLSMKNLSRNAHKWWSIAKKSCGLTSTTTIPTLSRNGQVYLTAMEKAACLNSAFAEQCSAPAAPVRPAQSIQDCQVVFSFDELEPLAVLKFLSALNVWKAPGVDGVCHHLLKNCASALAGPLCHIFNLSLKTGVFPQIWKTASVQPIFKNKGQRTDPKNYRPIALLPSISKVFEHFVQKQLLDYCLTNAIIPDEQFGFLPKRSTVWQLLTVLEDIHRALDDGVNVHACFLDISKAFDRVDHGLLLDKLARIGVKQTELAWFNSYLRNRNITTRVDGICSSESKISSGVPQGSVLGPLLFIVYMSDLPDVVSGSSALFADDTLVYDQCHGGPVTTCCRLQRDLSDVQQWAEEWATTFNPSKSAVMVFRGRHREKRPAEHVHLGKAEVQLGEVTRHLGVTVTKSLTWSAHIDNILNRVNYKTFVLKRLAWKCPDSTFVRHLFLCLVRPVLEYAGPVWDSCSKADCLRLERLQVSVARSILRLGRHSSSSSDILKQIGWPTLAWRRRRYKLLFLWKILNGHGPPSLRENMPATVDERAHQSLRRKTLEMPMCRTERRRQSFLPSSTALWNKLPDSVTFCTSSCSFLASLDSFYDADKYSFGLA